MASFHDIPEMPPATKSIAKSLFMVAAVVLRSNVTGNAANANKSQGPLMPEVPNGSNVLCSLEAGFRLGREL